MSKILYRRYSGAIGLTKDEIGTRGLWWEKRHGLCQFLVSRGHDIHFVNRMTKESSGLGSEYDGPYDLMIVEFGSGNKNFYGKDIEETLRMMRNLPKGTPKIFICDDPDLPLEWGAVSGIQNVFAWYNCVGANSLLNQPEAIKTYDMPFSSLVVAANGGVYPEPLILTPEQREGRGLCYLGRPDGRRKIIHQLLAGNIKFRVYGRQPEWDDLGITAHPAPNQPQRAAFYSKQLGCLALADAKHKILGWRTGRAFHAIVAGCPAVFESDHRAFAGGYRSFRNIIELRQIIYNWENDSDYRLNDLKKQRQNILDDLGIALATLRKFSL